MFTERFFMDGLWMTGAATAALAVWGLLLRDPPSDGGFVPLARKAKIAF